MTSASPRIAIVDYGMGNRRSVEKAFAHVGATPLITRDHDEIRAAAGVPVLGICLGMQLLFEHSSELRDATGLGLLAGEVTPLDGKGERIPHIGWNVVRFERATRLNAALPEQAAFYHVHSYVVRPTDPSDALGTAVYGERFVSAVARDNVFGVQFHPEKSSRHGLRLLASFSAACGGADAPSQPADHRTAA